MNPRSGGTSGRRWCGGTGEPAATWASVSSGATPEETLAHVAAGSPVPPHQRRPDVPPDLGFICLKCLARSPGRRYASVEALADDLRKFQEGKPVRPARLLGPRVP